MQTKRMLPGVCFGVLGLGVATLVLAEQARSTQQLEPASAAIGIVGKRVSNNAGDDLGVVDNVLIDPASGQVRGLVIGIGGMLGYGAYNYKVPWERVKFAQDHTQILVNVPRDKVNSEFPAYKKPQLSPGQKPLVEEHKPDGGGGKPGS